MTTDDEHLERRTNSIKNKILLDLVYHESDFFDNVIPATYEQVMENSWAFAAERIIERHLATISKGNLTFIDANGYDYTDYSDAKTFCTRETTRVNTYKSKKTLTATKTPSEHSYLYIITSLNTKMGAVRAICANSQKFCVDCFYIPANKLQDLLFFENRTRTKKLSGTYNALHDHYNKLEPFRVADIYELALASETYTPKPYRRTLENSSKTK